MRSVPSIVPSIEKVYLDLSFFDELDRRFGAPGDFAQAYVIAHELGHHVQHLLGHRAARSASCRSRGRAPRTSSRWRSSFRRTASPGVWGNSTTQRKLLEQGDVEEGLGAASAVGDDRIQSQMTGSIRPDKFTHGSSAQRSQWFRRGLESGDPNFCDTFGSLGRG